MTWSEDLVAFLPGSAQQYLKKQKTVFNNHFALAEKYVTEGFYSTTLSSLNRQDFLYHWLLVNSRCIFQQLSETSTRDDNYACAPLVDMINHVSSSSAHCKLSYDIRGLHVISETSYEAGEEVGISYGAHSNEALLCEYGFCMDDNPDDSLSLDDRLISMMKPYAVSLLMEIGYWEDYTLDERGRCSFRTEVALRALLLSEDDCIESSWKCRRLMHYIQGRYDGYEESSEVQKLLETVLKAEVNHAEEMIKKIERADISHTPQKLLLTLWQDRMTLAERGLQPVSWNDDSSADG